MAIVGVVEDTRSGGLRELPPPSVYIPYFQHAMAGATFSAAASGSLSDTAARMRQVVAARLPSSFPSVEEFSEQVERSLAQERLLASLAIAFALLAWLLALTGLGGLLSYNTVRRRQELGVRMALGATKSNVLGLVLSEAVHLIAIGVVVGLAAAWVASRWVSSLLFGLTASDPGVILGATGALVAAGLAVAFFPAYRAARADPATALRHD
jgi:ABC-type antimicrobial peptide transport system permease subunit